VLYRLFPDQAVPPAARIRAGVLAFAAGDALGLPWEGRPPGEIDPDQVAVMPARDGWPRGATSDDTAQLLLVTRHLVANGGRVSERVFLAELSRDLPAMRGAGPTTRAAVSRYHQTGEIRAISGDTNGALMRILPAGWAIPATHADRRQGPVPGVLPLPALPLPAQRPDRDHLRQLLTPPDHRQRLPGRGLGPGEQRRDRLHPGECVLVKQDPRSPRCGTSPSTAPTTPATRSRAA
jgi:hypothetical protein